MLAVICDYAQASDLPFLCSGDRKKPAGAWADQVARREVLIAHLPDHPVAWLRFGYLWDQLPFMKELHVHRDHQRQGIGRALVGFWEAQMKQRGHPAVLTSTMSSESAQHFYRRCGYVDVGGFVLPGEPLELLLYKPLT